MTDKTLKDFTKKEITEALKELKAEGEPYMYLQLSYMNIMLPYKDGLIIMEALKDAIVIKSNYGSEAYTILDEKLKFEGVKIPAAVALETKMLHLLMPSQKE